MSRGQGTRGTSIKEGALLALADLELTEICLPVLGHGKFLTSNITEASLPLQSAVDPPAEEEAQRAADSL